MHVPAAAAAAGTALTGKWLFDYNRANFQNDVPQRFARFMSSRNMLNAQVGQYRQDVAGIVTLTSSKMDAMCMMITLILAVCAALSDAGRIGMHGAAPPQWLCGLYSGHIASAVLYMGSALWLAMHASLRAQCAMVSLLTRKVRLPVPSMAQLDNARGFGSGFEQQKLGDIFRVPFMRHPQAAPELPEQSDDEDGKGKSKSDSEGLKKSKKASKARTDDFASTTRGTVPSWIRDEQVVDKGGGSMAADLRDDVEDHEAPEHFQLLAKAQEEWWQYDVYARILMLYGTIQFLFAVAYYSIGTTMSELRGFWISWSLPMMFLCGQVLILRLDIVKGGGNHVLPHAEWFGHVAPYFAIIGTTLEYRYLYSDAAVKVTYVVVFLAYVGHFIMAFRFLDLAWPDYKPLSDMPDEAGKVWWPSHWTVPSAFGRNLWLLAPPKKLEPGEHDLLQEMQSLQASGGGVTCRRRRKGPESEGAKPARKASSAQSLQSDSAKLESAFQRWFDESVWAQVSLDGQQRLTDLWGQYVTTHGQINQVGGSAKEQQVIELSDMLTGIEEGLSNFEASNRKSGEGAYTGASPFKEFGAKRASDLPWQIARVTILTTAFVWFYLGWCIVVDFAVGCDKLIKMPGEPPWIRDQKYRNWHSDMFHLSTDPTVPANYRLFKASAAHYHDGEETAHSAESHLLMGHASMAPALSATNATNGTNGTNGTNASVPAAVAETVAHSSGHRRLGRADDAVQDLMKALPQLSWLVEALEKQVDMSVQAPALELQMEAPAFMAPEAKTAKVVWPALFEPHHLLCRGSAVAALTSRGFGALAQLSDDEQSKATAFSLDGVGGFGALAGASWTPAGLDLVMKSGDMLACPGNGPESSGRWSCSLSKASTLPLPAGTRLSAAALSEPSLGAAGRTAALIYEHLPSMVSLFQMSPDADGWSPVGQVHLPTAADGNVGLSFAGQELLAILGKSGEVHRRNVLDGTHFWHAPPPSAPRREFRSACAGGALLRLALRQLTDGSAWVPEVISE
ncbi:unnamed protein product [Polarella glacialis]|uniref:Uncharacterized protein n=1 Tax=Polarella glacialis TaxID=89957 RepID=A0A813KT17_POLGL|nr:unnamed protein product [Polarella glacialis]